MQYALIDNKKTEATPKQVGVCECCGMPVHSRCGDYVVWHWSHYKNKDHKECDKWYDRKTEWHIKWQNYFPKENQEVVCVDHLTDEKHFADIKTNDGVVIELQNSPMSNENIRIRENFYDKMLWIVNGNNLGLGKISFRRNLDDIYLHKNYLRLYLFRTLTAFHKWSMAKKEVYFDFNDDKLYLLKKYENKTAFFEPILKGELIELNGGYLPTGSLFDILYTP